ncbi:hypothetical protein [Luteolibacter soli]|uniref:Two-component sensor histidine kinase n=1 Tax=Luteolibacter soli TaxID=3135280 RepID=A0ABU9AUV7_9BACT
MNLARVSSPPRPANGSQAHLLWICIRMALIFALALLPLIAVGVILLRGMSERAMGGAAVERPAVEVGTEMVER